MLVCVCVMCVCVCVCMCTWPRFTFPRRMAEGPGRMNESGLPLVLRAVDWDRKPSRVFCQGTIEASHFICVLPSQTSWNQPGKPSTILTPSRTNAPDIPIP